MKRCPTCNIKKNDSEFYKNKSKPDGLQNYCKICIKEKQQRYYEENKEQIYKKSKEYIDKNKEKRNAYYRKKYKENPSSFKNRHNKWEDKNKEYRLNYHKEYRKNNQENCIKIRLLSSARRRSESKKIEYNLDREWLEEKLKSGVCVKTGLSFIYEGNSPYTPSIDRIDSTKGYTKDNCQIVCKIYNFAKNIWDDSDVENMARGLLKESGCDNISKGDKYEN